MLNLFIFENLYNNYLVYGIFVKNNKNHSVTEGTINYANDYDNLNKGYKEGANVNEDTDDINKENRID